MTFEIKGLNHFGKGEGGGEKLELREKSGGDHKKQTNPNALYPT